MKRIAFATLATLAAAVAFGQSALYAAGRTISDQGIKVLPWGSGTIAETDEAAFEGTTSVRISTKNYFQGGRLILANPIDLASNFGDKNNLLLFAIKVADQSQTLGGGATAGGGRGAPTQGGTGGGVAGENRGGDSGARGGGGGSSAGAQLDLAALSNIRMIFTTTDGKKSEVYVPVTTSKEGNRGWRSVGIPLQAINGLANTNKVVKEIAISGDATATFFIGEIKILNDSTPLYVESNQNDLNLGLGSEVTFIAYGTGGASVLKYTWDFDSKDGIQVDAEGQVVKRKFRKPGDYVATLTVSDVYGLKKPYSTTIKITVNP